MEPFSDWYAILRVSLDASPKEISKAFRVGALEFHPDRNTGPGAAARFIELKKAYDVLCDPEKREAYNITYRLHMKKSVDQNLAQPSSSQRTESTQNVSPKPEPASTYIILDFVPGRSVHFVLRRTPYSLTPDEAARLTRDGMLHTQSSDRVYLLMYCIHCHALFTKSWARSAIDTLYFPYDIFPLCPHCQMVDWCPAEDSREQREEEEEISRTREALERLAIFMEQEKLKQKAKIEETKSTQVKANLAMIQRNAGQRQRKEIVHVQNRSSSQEYNSRKVSWLSIIATFLCAIGCLFLYSISYSVDKDTTYFGTTTTVTCGGEVMHSDDLCYGAPARSYIEQMDWLEHRQNANNVSVVWGTIFIIAGIIVWVIAKRRKR